MREMKDIWDFILVIVPTSAAIVGVLMGLVFLAERRNKEVRRKLLEKIDKDTNPKYAKLLRHNGRTTEKGNIAIVLDEDRWVVVQWDKKEDWITVFTPPRHENRIPVAHQWYNGKFEEVQKVRIEDLPRIS